MASPPAIAHLSSCPSPVIAIAQSSAYPDQQAQTAYQQGQYREAATRLAQAYTQYQGKITQAAIVLSNLSLTHQQLGNWQAAEEALTQTWQLLDNQPIPLSVQAQILDVQGQLYFARGHLDAALETWQQTADLYTQIGDVQRQALSQLYQYRWEWQLGRILKAEKQERRAIAAYTRAFETLKIIRSDWSQPTPMCSSPFGKV